MTPSTSEEVKNKMKQALILLKEAINMSIPLLRTEQRTNIIGLWEAFMREFLSFINRRSKETGASLINSISLSKIWLR